MAEFLSFLVLGIIRGMVYGVIALGINLIYKGSRTLNLSQPFMGLFAAYIAWYLTGQTGVAGLEIGGIETGPWFISWLQYPLGLFLFDIGTKPRFVLAAILSLLLIMRVGYRIEHELFRRLERAPRILSLVATIALAQGFLGIVQILFERTEEQSSQLKSLPALLPQSVSFEVMGRLPVTSADVQILIVVPLVAAAAAAFFKFSKFGVAIRASAENREAAQLLGISARRVASFTWIAAGFLAGLGALLIVPSQGSLDAGSLGIGLLIRALAASMLGGLTSLPGALIGGLGVGVTEFLIRWQTSEPGAAEVGFLLLVAAALVVRTVLRRTRDQGEQAAFAPSIREMPRAIARHPVAQRFRATAVIVGVMLASAVSLATGPVTNGILTDVLMFGIVGVSLTVLIGYAGQLSLGHFAFVGVGAFALGNLYSLGPVPFLVAIPLAVAIGMVASLALGLTAVWIRGPYLAVVTLAFAVACEKLLFSVGWVARGSAGVPVETPGWLASDTSRPLFFFGLALFLFTVWVAHNFKRSRTGRGFYSLRENEKAAETFGIELVKYRLIAFSLSGGMASLAGVLFGLRQGQVDAQLFTALDSLLVVAMVIIGGLGSLIGPLLGAFLMFGAPDLLQEAFGEAEWVLFLIVIASGISLILVITRLRGGLAGALFFPRDPVVQGLIWREEDAIRDAARSAAPATGDGRRAEEDETTEIETAKARRSSSSRSGSSSSSRSGPSSSSRSGPSSTRR